MATTEQPADCIFCRIARGEMGTPFVAASDQAVAVRDLHPQTPTHVLIVPKRHLTSLLELTPQDAALTAEMLALANDVARSEGLLERGYRVLTNVGPDAGQTVFHLHWHVLGGRPLGPLA